MYRWEPSVGHRIFIDRLSSLLNPFLSLFTDVAMLIVLYYLESVKWGYFPAFASFLSKLLFSEFYNPEIVLETLNWSWWNQDVGTCFLNVGKTYFLYFHRLWKSIDTLWNWLTMFQINKAMQFSICVLDMHLTLTLLFKRFTQLLSLALSSFHTILQFILLKMLSISSLSCTLITKKWHQ